jgi:aminopeptidase YwaD
MKQGIRIIPVVLLWIVCQHTVCQDTGYPSSVIARLCAREMHGRGFVRHGDRHAADFIRKEFRTDRIIPLGINYFQSFSIDVNTFPRNMKVTVNQVALVPGRDFIVDAASPGLRGSFVALQIPVNDILGKNADALLRTCKGRVVLVDVRSLSAEIPEIKRLWNEWKIKQLYRNPFLMRAIIEVTDDKFTFSTSTSLSAIPHIIMHAGKDDSVFTNLRVDIENKFKQEYETRNVTGFVRGTLFPDSFLVFTAHYDHLGLMGRKTYFPGANDNASGVAMLLELARYFSMHPQRCSIAFIGFSGEEAGLLGSAYFTVNPLIDLAKIKFLINLDLVGTGIDGITVVNATEFPNQYNLLASLNDKSGYVSHIKKRGKACNSDHCPFYNKGIPCFYIYTLGGIAAYHDLDDRPETLPLTAFPGLTNLLIGFAEGI